MKHFILGILLFLFAGGANAQSKADEETVRKLPQTFCEAWANHDGHELAKIMADRVDFTPRWRWFIGAGRSSMIGAWMGPCVRSRASE
jgi:hypothetical protein